MTEPTVYYRDEQITLYLGDALEVVRELPDGAADCIVTSPPYFGLRDYGIDGQYGLEESPAAYVETMRALFAELRRVLADDGTLWLNLGDSYASGGRTSYDTKGGTFGVQGLSRARQPSELPGKNLLGIPWRTAFALQDDGWTLRNAIIWHKPNAMPESVTDRLSGRYEHVFMFSKSRRYWFDLDPIREQCITADRPLVPAKHQSIDGSWSTESGGNHQQPTSSGLGRKQRHATEAANAAVADLLGSHHGYRGTHDAGRNPGDVWEIPTQPFTAAHFAVMPVQLAQRCILAGCKPGGTVLDPFHGIGTTGLAAQRVGRRYIGIDLNAEYLDLSLQTRLLQPTFDFETPA